MKAIPDIRILIVEDDPFFQRVLLKRLAAEGYQAQAASDGREGMRAIKEHKGYTIAQDESTCTLGDTPRMIADLGLADDILPLWAIPNRILELVGK